MDFNLAIEVFERAETSQRDSTHRTTVSPSTATQVGAGAVEQGTSTANNFSIKVSGRDQQRFADAVAKLVERIPAEKMLRAPQELEAKNELFILKQWLDKRRTDPSAWKVAGYALDVTLKDLSRAPRIEDYRAIAVVLPYMTDLKEAERLAKRIETQLGTNLSLGTTAESVRLEMLLERVRHRTSPDESELALINLYIKVDQIADAGIRATCLAWMLYALQRFPDPLQLETRTTVISETTQKLMRSIEALLESSGDHYHAAKSAIYALARANPEMAFQLVSKLNTEDRRDRGFATLVIELTSAKSHLENPGFLLKCIAQIQDEQKRYHSIIRCLYEICEQCSKEAIPALNDGILGLWRTIRAANYRFQSAIYAYRILLITSNDPIKIQRLEKEMEDLWPSILVDWVRTDLGYMLVRDIAQLNPTLAEKWFKKIVDEEHSRTAPSQSLSAVLGAISRLAITCYSHLATNDCSVDDPMFARIANLINSVATPQSQLNLWCDLGIRLHFRNKHTLSKKISVDYVQKNLDGVRSGLQAVPLGESFCQFVMRDGFFRVSRTTGMEALDGHPHQGVMESYVGLPLMSSPDQMFGTLCHFDFAERAVPDEEFAFLQRVARLLPRYL